VERTGGEVSKIPQFEMSRKGDVAGEDRGRYVGGKQWWVESYGRWERKRMGASGRFLEKKREVEERRKKAGKVLSGNSKETLGAFFWGAGMEKKDKLGAKENLTRCDNKLRRK